MKTDTLLLAHSYASVAAAAVTVEIGSVPSIAGLAEFARYLRTFDARDGHFSYSWTKRDFIASDGSTVGRHYALGYWLELFFVAHEYGHLLVSLTPLKAKRKSAWLAWPQDDDAREEEFFADAFATRVCLAALHECPWPPARWASAILFFDVMHHLALTGQCPAPHSHPDYQERATRIAQLIDSLSPMSLEGDRTIALLNLLRTRQWKLMRGLPLVAENDEMLPECLHARAVLQWHTSPFAFGLTEEALAACR